MRSAEEYAAMAERNMGRDDNGTAQVYASLAVAAATVAGMQYAIKAAVEAEKEAIVASVIHEMNVTRAREWAIETGRDPDTVGDFYSSCVGRFGDPRCGD